MALAYLTINLDAFTGDDRPPLSSYSTITLDPGADHIDAAADVIHVRTIVVSLDRQGKAATANGVPCVDGKVPVVAGVAYAVSAPNVLRGGPHYIPALTAAQVVDLSDYITPGAPLTPDQAATLTARIVALETTPPDHGALTGLNDDDHPQYALADGTRGAFAAPLGADDNYVTDAEKAALHAHSNKAALDLVSGTNTGDQTLPTWSTISGKPAVVAEGATQAEARTAIGLGSAATTASTAYATAAQGALADAAVQPAALAAYATAAQGALADTAVQPADLSAYATTGDVADAIAASSSSKADKADLPFNVKDFGATGDGVTDDTAAIRAALDVVKNARVVDSGTNKRPGAKVVIPAGTYMLTSLAEPLEICGNVESQGAVFVVPAAYAGVALLVGAPESGGYLVDANISLPDVVKPKNSAIVAGSEAVRVMNLGNSVVQFGKAAYFERGYRFSGDNQGTVYNQFFLGWVIACKIALTLKPHAASGWCNSNTFVGGGVQQSVTYAGGTRLAGWFHVEMDGSAGHFVNGNTFLGVSFEGDVSQYWLKSTEAASNTFIGCRHELGALGVASAVSGDTITTTAHGLTVGDMVGFNASSAPTGMALGAPYFVVTVVDADSYKVSAAKSGTAITFPTAGTGVVSFRPPTAWFGGSTSYNNVMRDPYTPMGFMELIQTTAAGNVLTTGRRQHAETYDPSDSPVFSARNSYQTGTPSRPAFAAYPPTVSPQDDPFGWSTAIGDRGILFAASRLEIGRIFNVGGILQYRRPGDTSAYEIPSVRRISAPVAITALSLAAGATTTTTVTLTGASVNDYAMVDVNADLPSGVAIAWVRVSAANTVKIGLLNITAAPISLTVNVQVLAIRRYY